MAGSASVPSIAVCSALVLAICAAWALAHADKKMALVGMLAGTMIIGGVYTVAYNAYHMRQTAPLIGKETDSIGHVVDIRRTGNAQRATVLLDKPNAGAILVTTRAYPELSYGDRIALRGTIKRPQKKQQAYLMKDALFAVMDFPRVAIIAHDDGSKIKTGLFRIKERFTAVYGTLLPADEAALLSGIMVGDQQDFDGDFKQAMKNSGTTHIVALSGYNISVVIDAVMAVLLVVFSRRVGWYVALGAIAAFVVMTGAQSSVVRAAIMGAIVLLGERIGRAHSIRNAILASAVMMALYNPNVVRYDLGFQLSFLAFLGIVYVKPHTDAMLANGKATVEGLRKHASETIAAQIAVFPILMHATGMVSVVSIISNMAILGLMPATMLMGFIMGTAGLVSTQLAMAPAAAASLLLKYEIGIINIFGAYKGITVPMSAAMMGLYYVLLGGALWIIAKRDKKQKTTWGK